ncbi:PstS family phosphate ABC transporter substrate-binding protein [Methanoregula formicica]|uniref:ABC-type phosphate transport system, periplasmic component n=1 Tax=Methanoregula formicica (strain DSM 22288 / NBRC 105244 / SMSP) TaxID=593750 RepID=L0HCG0_METFS|nr:substrate-binding domain-containing protein [Methanoregula formicica]AGB01496.1 ABC-type phosphate transport system, periplasmic component [Methanoregula formicica SMSP]
MKVVLGLLVLFLVMVALVAAGCTIPHQDTNVAGSGKITVSGAFALYPMMVKWAEEYQKLHPDVKIEISAGGAGKGMTDTLSGMVDLGMVSRDISSDEANQGAVWVAVTKDAVVPTVSSDNPVLADLQSNGVKQSVFREIFINKSTTTWGQVAGRPGITDPVNVYTRSDACGAADVWAKYLGYKQENLQGVGIYGDPGLADAVKSDRLGVGYNNIGFAYDADTGKPLDGLAIIPLDINENGNIDPNEQVYATRHEIVNAINTGKYPSPPARELNIVAKTRFSGPTKEFVQWILTDGQQYVEGSGYIALPKERVNEQLVKLDR